MLMQETISVPVNRHASGIPILPTTTIETMIPMSLQRKKREDKALDRSFEKTQRHPADEQPMHPIH